MLKYGPFSMQVGRNLNDGQWSVAKGWADHSYSRFVDAVFPAPLDICAGALERTMDFCKLP